MRDIIVTVPKSVKWEDYQKELQDVEEKGLDLNYKVFHLPKGIIFNQSKCYITYNGVIKGWMIITGFKHFGFKCQTTGKDWDGNFIVRSGKFHSLESEESMSIAYKGFQGFRYFSLGQYLSHGEEEL
jgi:hypothetical protein